MALDFARLEMNVMMRVHHASCLFGHLYAAAVIGDLETANKSLVDVHRNMKKVVGLLSQLNRLDEQFNVPAPVFAQR